MAEGVAVLALQGTTRRLVAVDADLSGSEFSDVALRGAAFRNADLSDGVIENARMIGVRISDADLSGCVIAGCTMVGMTIDGVAVSELLAAWRAVHGAG